VERPSTTQSRPVLTFFFLVLWSVSRISGDIRLPSACALEPDERRKLEKKSFLAQAERFFVFFLFIWLEELITWPDHTLLKEKNERVGQVLTSSGRLS